MSDSKLQDQSLVSKSNELVYLFVASRGGNHPTLKQVQNALRFSSPSSALFHLQKLEQAGIVGKDQYSNYYVTKPMTSPYVSRFVVVRKMVLPKRLLYAMIVTAIAIMFALVLSRFIMEQVVLLALAPNLFSAAIFWYEAYEDWKTIPHFSS